MNIASFGKYISILSRQEQRYMKEELKRYDLGYTSYKFLFYIASHKGCSQKDICNYMALNEAVATRTVRELQEKGFVKREKREDNARMYEISLTEKGNEILPYIKETLYKWWSYLTDMLSQEETEKLLFQLKKMSEKIERTEE